MKNAILISTITTFTAAQTITDLPSCSFTCLSDAIDSIDCSLTDFGCSCNKASQLTPVVTPCVRNACTDPANQVKAFEALSQICAAAGFPIEVPAPPASPPVVEPAPAASSEKQPYATEKLGYSEYPTATEVLSEYLKPFHITDDVPNLPSFSDLVPVPSFVDTIIVSRPSTKPTSIPDILPPYPTGTPVSAPLGTGSPSTSSLNLPEFTGGTATVQVPILAAGVFGMAAIVL